MSGNMPKQIVGNGGVFYVAYELSKRGWNCLLTTRNAAGVDLLIYSQDGKRRYLIEVKSLTGKKDVGLSKTFKMRGKDMIDYLVICRNVFDNPELYILKNDKIIISEDTNKRGEKSYWLERKYYEKYKNNWGDLADGR